MLDIYPLDLYNSSIYLTYAWDMTSTKFWGRHVTPYIWHILSWLRYMWYILHTFGVTWRPPKFRRSRISGICQIYRSSGYMSSLYCHMLIIYLEYSIQKLELEYFRNMPDIYLTKSGIFHIPGGWSVSWCWKEKWIVNVHAVQLHD